MGFSAVTIEQVRLANPLAELVAEHADLRRRGGNLTANCLFHEERTPSFFVFPDDRGGHYHCFGCGCHGDGIDFTMQQMGLGFTESVRYLAERAGIEIVEDARFADRRRLQGQVFEVMDLALRMAQATLPALASRDPAHPAIAVLNAIGLDITRAGRAGLGFVPDGGLLIDRLRRDGVPEEILQVAGFVDPEGRDALAGRIVHPVLDRIGRVVALIGQPVVPAADGSGLGVASLVLHPDTGRLPSIFHYGRPLLSRDTSRPQHRPAPADHSFPGIHRDGIVVPDFLAASVLAGHGFKDVLAPTGGLMLPDAITAAWRVADEPILAVPDDPSGNAFLAATIEGVLPLVGPGRSFRFLRVAPSLFPGAPDFDPLVFRLQLEAAEHLVDAAWRLEAPVSPSGGERPAAHRAASAAATPDPRLVEVAAFLDRTIDRVRGISHVQVRAFYALEYAARAKAEFDIDPGWPEADPARIFEAEVSLA